MFKMFFFIAFCSIIRRKTNLLTRLTSLRAINVLCREKMYVNVCRLKMFMGEGLSSLVFQTVMKLLFNIIDGLNGKTHPNNIENLLRKIKL